MYFLLGISLILAFLLIVNMFVAVFASALWSLISRFASGLSVASRGHIIFGLRILPVAVAFIFVSAFVIPAYLLLEPDASGETVSLKLAFLASLSSLGVGIALYRVFQTWIVTRGLAYNWLKQASEIALDGITVPVYRIKHPFPVIAVIGVFRPRMFVAEQVLESLDRSELLAAAAHECGHLQANDNFKRTILRLCRDLLILPFGKGLDRAWADNAESLADEYAARSGRSTALELASALVKIARIVPAHAVPAMPAGAFLITAGASLIDAENADVTSRVRHLVTISESTAFSTESRLLGLSAAGWFWSISMAMLISLPLTVQSLLIFTHDAIEKFVSFLQ